MKKRTIGKKGCGGERAGEKGKKKKRKRKSKGVKERTGYEKVSHYISQTLPLVVIEIVL